VIFVNFDVQDRAVSQAKVWEKFPAEFGAYK